jgi:hypothetical protein
MLQLLLNVHENNGNFQASPKYMVFTLIFCSMVVPIQGLTGIISQMLKNSKTSSKLKFFRNISLIRNY